MPLKQAVALKSNRPPSELDKYMKARAGIAERPAPEPQGLQGVSSAVPEETEKAPEKKAEPVKAKEHHHHEKPKSSLKKVTSGGKPGPYDSHTAVDPGTKKYQKKIARDK